MLRHHVADESVDLVYLDPPFNSNRSYNLLFKHQDGRLPAAQAKAFDDTWRWDQASAALYREVVALGGDVSRVLRAFHEFLGGSGTNSGSDMLAYLTMMAPRLIELRRVLKPTGSLYLHCDPTASHYLKMLLDAIFGPSNFVNEIIWKRQSSHNDAAQGARHLGRIHDVLLFYGASEKRTWHQPYRPYDQSYVDRFYRFTEVPSGRRYGLYDITAPGGASPEKRNPHYEFLGVTRYWRFSRDRMRELHVAGRIVQTKPGRVPRQKRYLDEMPGMPVGTIWDDISPLQAHDAERLGYPTQKPLALLERILEMSSNEGDVVLDPFCGCGTAMDAAIKLNRRWIGIDVTRLATDIIEERIRDQHGAVEYTFLIEPTTIDEAVALARKDKNEFQQWVRARLGIPGEMRRGADRGIDGEIVGVYDNGDTWKALVSVKGGGIKPSDLRDLHGTVTRENAETGVFVSLHEPTGPMRRAAVDAGVSEDGIPRLQLVTVADLFAGVRPQLPVAASRAETRPRLRAI
ncbi:MAG: site-specific DNA-methyltransferase [Dehalococcoidia bacterium]|nr:site-specific DNA-methyltransferase [Dehalococcoidia bacterium]